MKIDASQISGFDEMTPEQKVEALLELEYDDGSAKLKAAEENNAKLKAAVDKASSEAAGYKKQLNAKLTDDERKQQENEATMKAMQERLAEYEKRDKISTATAAFLKAGFDEKTATIAAEAFTSGDIDSLAPALKTFKASVETSTKSSLMAGNPVPTGSTEPKVRTKADILAIQDYAEQQAAIEEYITANGGW